MIDRVPKRGIGLQARRGTEEIELATWVRRYIDLVIAQATPSGATRASPECPACPPDQPLR